MAQIKNAPEDAFHGSIRIFKIYVSNQLLKTLRHPLDEGVDVHALVLHGTLHHKTIDQRQEQPRKLLSVRAWRALQNAGFADVLKVRLLLIEPFTNEALVFAGDGLHKQPQTKLTAFVKCAANEGIPNKTG